MSYDIDREIIYRKVKPQVFINDVFIGSETICILYDETGTFLVVSTIEASDFGPQQTTVMGIDDEMFIAMQKARQR